MPRPGHAAAHSTALMLRQTCWKWPEVKSNRRHSVPTRLAADPSAFTVHALPAESPPCVLGPGRARWPPRMGGS